MASVRTPLPQHIVGPAQTAGKVQPLQKFARQKAAPAAHPPVVVGARGPAIHGHWFCARGKITASALRLFRDAVLFVLRAQNTVDRIRGAAAGFVVMADLHFAEQADGEQVQTAEQQPQSQHHERTVRSHHMHVAQEFFYPKPQDDAGAPEEAEHAEGSKEVQRAREIAQQEADGKQIEEDAEGARDAVVRSPAFAVHVANRDFADGRAVP